MSEEKRKLSDGKVVLYDTCSGKWLDRHSKKDAALTPALLKRIANLNPPKDGDEVFLSASSKYRKFKDLLYKIRDNKTNVLPVYSNMEQIIVRAIDVEQWVGKEVSR